jgi:hypothetical protein
MSGHKEIAEIAKDQRQSLPSEYPVAMRAGVAGLIGVLVSVTGSFFSFSPNQQFLDPVSQFLFSVVLIVLFAAPSAIVSYVVTARRLKENVAINAVTEGYRASSGSMLSDFQAMKLLQRGEFKLPGGKVLRVLATEDETEKVVLIQETT